jgi:predicted transcriptional regulator
VNPVENALISIRPGYADAIFTGSKTVELRRRIPPISNGTMLWIYVTKPVGAVLGVAEVKEIVAGTPAEVWARCNGSAGLDRSEFDRYFDASESAFGLVLASVRKGLPATMDTLKKLRPGFHPPQVMTRLTDDEAESLNQHIFRP